MTKFKSGDKVILINDNYHSLKMNTTYIVDGVYNKTLTLIGINPYVYVSDNFIKLSEYRKQKIKSFIDGI
jgi:hypothetical protein